METEGALDAELLCQTEELNSMLDEFESLAIRGGKLEMLELVGETRGVLKALRDNINNNKESATLELAASFWFHVWKIGEQLGHQ